MSDSTDETAVEETDRPLALAKAIREARGQMLQVDFARLVDRPQSVISNWETKGKTPSLETLADIEERLGLPLGYLAVQAGYFSPEAVGGLPKTMVAAVECSSLLAASEAVAAADLLGLGSLLESVVLDGERVWKVAVAHA
jgi:transcriptional regulator with XRE-family HTH domain